MAQSGVLGKPEEFFKTVPYARWGLQEDRIDVRCELARTLGVSENGICGIKIFPRHMAAVQRQINLCDWFPRFSLVWIRRRDLLGQAISGVIARQTRSYRSYYKDGGVTPEYSAADIAWQMQKFATDEARWRVYLARTGHTAHEVYYEDLVRDPAGVMQQLGKSIGVEIDTGRLSLGDSGLKVQRSEINEQWRERFIAEQGDPNVVQMQFSPEA